MKITICKLCKTKTIYSSEFGDYCPNPSCDNLDGIFGKQPEECFEEVNNEEEER